MRKTLLSLLMCIVLLFGASVSVSAEPDLTIDFNKRYTDISYYDEVNDPYLDSDKNSEEKQQKRNIYVVVLSVCLVAAIGVFIYTLRKVPDEDTFEKNEKKKIRGTSSENTADASSKEKSLKDEEKTL